MEKGTESDSALSGQTEKHIVSLDALCNLAPFTPQSKNQWPTGDQNTKNRVCEREKETEKTTKKRERTERKSTLFPRHDNYWKLRLSNIISKASSLLLLFDLYYFGNILVKYIFNTVTFLLCYIEMKKNISLFPFDLNKIQ